MSKIKNFFYLFLPLILGSLIGFITNNNIDYEYLVQPLLSPPAIVFPIVWTILYFLMGLSFYLYKKHGIPNKELNSFYYTQLFFNLVWPIIFFTFKFRFIATIWIIVLDILIIYMLKLFYKYYRLSFKINIPYLIWTLFATYLTFSIYLLN